MPAYVQHHTDESAPDLCPSCVGMLPMYLRDVVPHWNLATIDVIYECSECGTEVRTTVTKPTQRNEPVSAGAVTKPISDRSPQSARPLRTARALV